MQDPPSIGLVNIQFFFNLKSIFSDFPKLDEELDIPLLDLTHIIGTRSFSFQK